MLFPSVLALTQKTCIDSNTLRINTTKMITTNGNVTNFNIVEDIDCEYGCSSSMQTCRPSNVIQIFLALLSIAFFISISVFGFSQSKGMGLALSFFSASSLLMLLLTDFFSTQWRLFFIGGIALIMAHAFASLGEE